MSGKLIRRIRHLSVLWTLALGFLIFIRSYGLSSSEGIHSVDYLFLGITILTMGVFSGTFFAIAEVKFEFFFHKRQMPFGVLLAVGFLVHIYFLLILILVGVFVTTYLYNAQFDLSLYWNVVLSTETFVLFAYSLVVAFFIDLYRIIDRKMGPGNLGKMLRGQFYKPKEERRIFMFLDLKSSSALAEKLGHIKYSRLLQECFHELAVMTKYGAEVYQYVGDEAVLTWRIQEGLPNNQCINAFFAFQHCLEERRQHFINSYGVHPEFKAGINAGLVTAAEVGDVKQEIAYHGDTINTAARIQDMCNPLNARLLISESVLSIIKPQDDWALEALGTIELKGKAQKVDLYKVCPKEVLEAQAEAQA